MYYIGSSNVFNNLSAIVTEVREISDAPIVVYNVYNPFQVNDPLHDLALNVLPTINVQMKEFVDLANDQLSNVILGDAYTAFGSNQVEYVIVNDIHPTFAGHVKLSEVGLEALNLKK